MGEGDDDVRWSRPLVQPHDTTQQRTLPPTTSRETRSSTSSNTPREHKSKSLTPSNRSQHSRESESLPPLLRWRVYTREEYSEEFYRRPSGQKVVPHGALPSPVPVPLHPGETVAEYEQKFLAYLASRGRSPAEFVGKPNHERSLRIQFGNKRLLSQSALKSIATAKKQQRTKSRSNSAKRDMSASPRTIAKSNNSNNNNNMIATNNNNNNNSNSAKRGRSESPPPQRKRATTVANAPATNAIEYHHSAAPPVAASASANANAMARTSATSSGPSPTGPTPVRSAATDVRMLAPPPPHVLPPPQRPLNNGPNGASPHIPPMPGMPMAMQQPMQPMQPMQPPPSAVAVGPIGPRCIAQLPAPTAPRTAFIAAYMSCGCRQCMCDWNLMLTEQLEVLENDVRRLRAQQSASVSAGVAKPVALVAESVVKPVSAVKLPADTTPNHESSEPTQSKPAAAEPSGQAAVEPSSNSDPAPSETPAAAIESAAPDDAIRTRLIDEYNALNSQILLNEQVVDDSIQRVRTNMMHDAAGAMHEHAQIQQLQDAIEYEVERRDEALAVLIVHCHEHAPDALLAQVDALGSLNILHAQRASHAKCAALAAQISATQSALLQLCDVRNRVATGANSAATPALQALENQVAAEQQALAALEQQRMDEVMEIFRFSHQVRADCRALLVPSTTTSSNSS